MDGRLAYAVDLSNRDKTIDLLIFALRHRYIEEVNDVRFFEMFAYRR